MTANHGSPSPKSDGHLTRRDAVLHRLREDIVSGALPPGTIIKDAALAAELGVSITPVREAISQLAVEGLIDISPNRARRVTGESAREVVDLVDVAALLARAGFEAGLDVLSPARAAELRARLSAAEVEYREGRADAAMAAIREVVETVITAAGNRHLQLHLDLVHSRTRRALAPLDDTIWDVYLRGYGEMLEALERGDRAAALDRHRRMQAEYRERVARMVGLDPAELPPRPGRGMVLRSEPEDARSPS